MNIRRWFSRSKNVETRSQPVVIESLDAEHADDPGAASGGSSDLLNALPAGFENNDPTKRRFVRARRGLLHRLAREAKELLFPRPLSPEEKRQAEEEKARKLKEKSLRADAEVCAAWMQSSLTRLGICYRRVDSEGNIKRLHKVMFDEIRMEDDRLHVHVNMQRLPFGVSIQQLIQDETLQNLAASVGRHVTVNFTPLTGVVYTIERASGHGGIKSHVMLSDMWERMPASAGSLMLPVGESFNARLVYEDLAEMPHLLIGGATMSGKTNFLHVIICTLMRRNEPSSLRAILVDLKGGMSFTKYLGVPHLFTHPDFCADGVITQRGDVYKALTWLITEGERRMGLLREAGMEKISEYNYQRRRNRLPYIVLIIDELSDLMYDKEIKTDAEKSLANIVQRMRAVGIHVIVATQIPRSEVLTGLIKGNMPARLAFSVPNNHASMAILDNSMAVGLGVRGRCVMQYRDERQIQTPYISPETVKQIVEGAKTGEFGRIAAGHDVTPREVQEWAVQEQQGWLIRDRLFAHFRERGLTIAELNDWLESWDNEEFIVGNTVYRCDPAAGRRGRRLVAVDQQTDKQEENTPYE